ncbi:MAG: 2-oxoacid:acceptor oxidoreductase family protein [Chloroflexota bacterium]
MRKEIRIGGFGGQGIGLAGHIIGKALTIYDGKEAVMTQAYGPEARGGASSANIVLADRPIDYPFVQHPDVLIILSQEAYTKFRPTAQPEAIILIDENLVIPTDDDMVHKIPATQIAEELGWRIISNMVMLGFFTATTGLVSRGAMEQSIATSVKQEFKEVNLLAFARGFEYAPLKAPGVGT